MAMKYLGETLDIHTGGIDLAFSAHENEIAQSEGATGKLSRGIGCTPSICFVEGEKMSKSQGNFFTLRDLFAKVTSLRLCGLLWPSVPYRKAAQFYVRWSAAGGQLGGTAAEFRRSLKRENSPLANKRVMAARIAKGRGGV